MKKLGLEIHMKTPFDKVVKDEETGLFKVILSDGKGSLEAEKILLAMGRPPVVKNMGLENTDITLEKGAIKADEYQNTSVEGVYAIGDVINKY